MARQDQECRLECILGIVIVAHHLAAHSLHHRSVPLDDCCKSGFIAIADELVEQLTVGESDSRTCIKQYPQMMT